MHWQAFGNKPNPFSLFQISNKNPKNTITEKRAFSAF